MCKLSKQEFYYNNISYNNYNVIIIISQHIQNHNFCISFLIFNTFRTLVYLMPEAYSRPCQISKMMRHAESPGVIRQKRQTEFVSDEYFHITERQFKNS